MTSYIVLFLIPLGQSNIFQNVMQVHLLRICE